MKGPFVSNATSGGRLFWYVLPLACVLWIALFYYQRPTDIPIITTTSYAPAAATTTTSTGGSNTTTTDNNSSSSNSNRNNSGGGGGGGNKNKDGIAAVATINPAPPIIQQLPDPCAGRYVYVHDLPSRFNTDIVRECRALSELANKSQFMSNAGLGPEIGESGGVFFGFGGWYATDQFALDIIFYNRMKRYACLTNDYSRAAAVFVPFFAGLDASRYLVGYNTSVRDSTSLDLVRWLRSRPEWGMMRGRDHFLVAGRPAWDFRRHTDSDSVWGNKLLLLPEVRNMSVLLLESSTWLGNDFSIPYPTYFHPSEDGQVSAWQERIRGAERPWLFTFAGAPRPILVESIRGQIIEQCRASRRCRLLDCGSNATDCHSPGSVIGAFQGTSFCLQPAGDSFTRRSAFDAMLAGCVPVFFHPASAYKQYQWHLPRNHSSYSVFIPEEEVRQGQVSIEERLAAIPEGEVKAMREEVVKMIPRLVYADPRASLVRAKDAFELAVEGVIERVGRLRREMRGEMSAAVRSPTHG